MYPLLLSAKKIVITNICAYNYRIRDDSLTSKRMDVVDETENHLLNRFCYLKGMFERGELCWNLHKQLERYIYFNLLLKYPEKLFDEIGEKYLPFLLEKGERIVVYGSGQLGIKLAGIFNKLDFCRVMYMTDKTAYGKMEIRQTIALQENDYDKVIVATLNSGVSREIVIWLEILGIAKQKISTLRYDEGLCHKIVSLWAKKMSGGKLGKCGTGSFR